MPSMVPVYTRILLTVRYSNARAKEAALFVLKQILDELDSCSAEVNPNLARTYLEYIGLAMRDGKWDFGWRLLVIIVGPSWSRYKYTTFGDRG